MGKNKFKNMVLENQKFNKINLRMFAVASKSVNIEDNNKSTKNKVKMSKNKKTSINMALSAA